MSLKAAYLAVLWLEEEKLEIEQKNRFGEWHIDDAENKSLTWSRSQVALNLPPNHFDNSLYGSESDDVLQLGNIVDGELCLDADAIIYEREDGDALDPFSKAHLKLVELLKQGAIEARSKYAFSIAADEIGNFRNSTIQYEYIDPDLWSEKPLPNYQISALHLGMQQGKYIFAKFQERDIEAIKSLLNQGFEYWLTKIEVNKKAFDSWLQQQLPKHCLLPAEATLKPHNGKFLVQFGDEHGEYEANKGLEYIFIIIKYGTTHDFQRERISVEDLKSWHDGYEISSHSNQSEYFSEQIIEDDLGLSFIEGKNVDIELQKRYLRFLTNITRYYIEQYWDIREPLLNLNKEDMDDRLSNELESRRGKALSYASRADYSLSKVFGKDKIYRSLAKGYLDADEPPEQKRFKADFKVETTDEEKSIDAVKKAIQREIKRMQKQFPKFSRHLGKANTQSQSGIIIHKHGFSYFPGGNIKWKTD